MKLSRFRAPDTILIVFAIIVLAAVSAWFIPAGEFERELLVVDETEREVVVPGSFSYIAEEPVGFFQRLFGTLGAILMAPISGITEAALIIAFVLLVGGTFAVLQATGAVVASLRRLVALSERSDVLRLLLIPIFMALFSLGGATFGMSEEIIPFVLIFVPLALALGYDTITGVAIPFVGAQLGFAAAFLNPFTVGVAQGIAEVPLFSGFEFRLVMWAVVTAVGIAVVMWHAHRVRRDPSRSPTFDLDQKERAKEGLTDDLATVEPLGTRHSLVLIVFAAGIALLAWGVLPPERGGFGWYIPEIAALFVGLGIAIGVVGRLSANRISEAFQDGARDLVVTALVIGLARGILVVLRDAQVIDTILFGLASAVGDAGPTASASMMFISQSALNFFVPSGSGQAALTMPLMAPLADLLGVTRQTAVLAFQLGDGFTNLIIPTSAVLMGVLSLAKVPWITWARWIIPFQLLLFLLGFIALAIAVATGYGAVEAVAIP